jgi:hypothetical protein
MSRWLIRTLLLCVAWPSLAAAQNSVRRDGIEVHYSAVPTMGLAPEIAQRYAITRSATRGLLSIVVLRDGDGGQHPVDAAVRGTATAANGDVQDLAIRAVREGDAVSYLAEPRIADGASLSFDVSVTPAGSNTPIVVRFAQEFFAPR